MRKKLKRNISHTTTLIKSINEISKSSRNIYYIYILFLFYCLITIVNTSDVQIILNNKVVLPLLNAEVPLTGFFILSPIVALLIFVYLQIYLHRLKTLKNRVTIKNLHIQFYPWIINISEIPDKGFLGILQRMITKFTIWWLLPIVLHFFSLWFIKKHHPILIYIIGFLPVLGTCAVLYFWLKYDNIEYKLEKYKKLLGKLSMFFLMIIYQIFYLTYLVPSAFSGESKFFKNFLYLDLNYKLLSNYSDKEHDLKFLLDLSNTHLEGANFTGAVLRKTNFYNANLNNAKFDYASLEGSSFNNTSLQNVDFENSNLKHTTFKNIKSSGINFSSAEIQDAFFKNVTLTGTNFEFATLKETVFAKTILDDSKFTASNLEKVYFSEASLKRVKFSGAVVIGRKIKIVNLKGVNFENSDLDSADFGSLQSFKSDKMLLIGGLGNYGQLNLEGLNFRNSNLSKANFDGAILKNAILSNANMKGINLIGASLRNSNLDAADLINAKGLSIDSLKTVKSILDTKFDKKMLNEIKKHIQYFYGKNGKNPKSHHDLAYLFQYTFFDYDSAKFYYEKALENNNALYHNDYALLLGNSYFKDYISAKNQFEIALDISPESEIIHINFALLLYNRLLDYSQAVKHLNNAIKLNPKNAKAHHNLAIIYSEHIKQPNLAKKHYLSAIKYEPNNSNFHNNYGLLLDKYLKEYTNAKNEYKLSIKLDSTNSEAHVNYAVLLYEQFNNNDIAELHFKKAIKNNSSNFRYYYNYAKFLSNFKDRFEETKENYLQAIKLNPELQNTEADNCFGIN